MGRINPLDIIRAMKYMYNRKFGVAKKSTFAFERAIALRTESPYLSRMMIVRGYEDTDYRVLNSVGPNGGAWIVNGDDQRILGGKTVLQ